MRIDEGESVSKLQVLERHRFDQRRFAGACLPYQVYVQKAILVPNPESADIITKSNLAYAHE